LPEIDEFQLRRIDSMTLEVEVLREQNLNQLFEYLDKCNIQVGNIRSKSNRLEELFIRLLNNKDEIHNGQ
jgi:ABC-2 type transport system ATP-binding protein